ncbi:hypothetical protein E2C01_086865 [Portunus trituberculatus]|uniref:Uncharacterized protein n=1 Tax=Portunus trituberculatus TaxID=210409 RepID=A0A5B7JAV9_PORTR|nr:hypothetical protein [Portunus trituberculatus]
MFVSLKWITQQRPRQELAGCEGRGVRSEGQPSVTQDTETTAQEGARTPWHAMAGIQGTINAWIILIYLLYARLWK